MAERYSSFNSQGPNIDVDLFVNAASAGIAQGNAQKSTWGAIASGVSEGIKSGVSAYQGIQAGRLAGARADETAQQVAFENDPEVRAAREQQAIAEAQLKEQEAKAGALTGTADAMNKAKIAEANALKATQFIQDSGIIDTIGSLFSNPAATGEQFNSVLDSKEFSAFGIRNPEEAMNLLAGMGERGADPIKLDKIGAQLTAAATQKKEVARVEDQTKRAEIAREETDKKFTESQNTLKGVGSLAEAVTDVSINPKDIEAYPANTVVIDKNGNLEIDAATKKPRRVTPIVTPGEKVDTVFAVGSKVYASVNAEDASKYREALINYKTGAAARPEYATRKGVYDVESLPKDAATSIKDEGVGLASQAGAAQAGMAPAPPNTNVNTNIQEAARQRNEQRRQQAASAGIGNSYDAMVQQGQAMARKNAPAPDYISSNQTVPVAPGAPKITQPIATPTATSAPLEKLTVDESLDIRYPHVHFAFLVGVKPNQISFDFPKTLDASNDSYKETFLRVKNIPELKNAPAILKGLVSVESEGKNNTVGSSGEKGLFQFMAETAGDVGLTPEERTDPEKATPAAIEYLTKQYQGIERVLEKQLSDQGMSVKVDPRMVLAAYNGGLKWIKNGIQAGNTTWPQMVDYLYANKSPDMARINTEYPDKVIEHSIPFMVGGNASDDSYAKTLLDFGIVGVR